MFFREILFARGTRRPWSIVATFLLFGVLWICDFPKPTVDDLFYMGAGLNLADGGDLSNPLLARQEFPSRYFYVYPPLESCVLSGWLKIFGINTLAVTGFCAVMAIVASTATIVVLRRFGVPLAIELCVPLGWIYAVYQLGLRAEPLAIALVMSGFALEGSEFARRRHAVAFAAFLLMFLGCSTAPRVLIFGAGLIAASVWKRIRNEAGPRNRLLLTVNALSALLVSILVFLFMIGFRLREFLQTFRFFAAGRAIGSKMGMLTDYFVHILGYLQCSIFVVLGILAIWMIKKPKDPLSGIFPFLIVAFFGAGLTGVIGLSTTWWPILMLLFLAAAASKHLAVRPSIALQAVVLLLMLMIDRKFIAECFGNASGAIKSDLGDQIVLARTLASSPEHPLLLDGWSARYVYQYKLPKGSLDFASGTKFPGIMPGAYLVPGETTSPFRPGDIYLLGSYMLGCLNTYSYLDFPTEPYWSPLHIRGFKFDRHPRRIYVVRSEDCKGARKERAMPLPNNR